MFKLLQAKTILNYGCTTSFFKLFSNRTTGSYYPYVWVEGGIFSGKIFNELYPKLKEGATTLTQKIQSKLSLLSFKKFNGLYLLPGNEPSANFGDYGDTRDNSTLVLVE